MPKTFIGTNAVVSTTISIPAHVSGDAIIIVAYRASATPATVPSGWTTLCQSGTANLSVIVGAQIATSSGTTSGTWTNAARLQVFVWRGPTGFGSANTANSASSGTTITYPAITLDATDGTSALALFGGTRSITSTIETAPASGFTRRGVFLDSVIEFAGFDSDAGVTSFSATAQNIGGTSASWTTATVELLDGGDGGAITATASGTHTITGAAVGDVDIAAAVSGTYTVTGSAVGNVRIAAAASGTYTVTGSAAAGVVVTASASGTYTVTGSAAATTANIVTASASGTHTITGSAAGDVDIAAAASGTYTISGAATAGVRIVASASGTYTVTGASTGTVSTTRTATAAGTHTITGTATGTVATLVTRQIRLRPDGRLEAYI